MEIDKLLKELGLENRMEILNLLRDSPATTHEVKRELRKRGTVKSYTTVRRCLENLSELGLLYGERERFKITTKGRYFLGFLKKVEKDLRTFDHLEGYLPHSMDYIPRELLGGIRVLEDAELLTHPYAVTLKTFEAARLAEKRIGVINASIVSEEFDIEVFPKLLDGVEMDVVVPQASIPRIAASHREAVGELGLSEEETGAIRENLCYRTLDPLKFNLLLVEDRAAGISLPGEDDRWKLTPAFYSEEKEFINWVGDIFSWYWERAEPME